MLLYLTAEQSERLEKEDVQRRKPFACHDETVSNYLLEKVDSISDQASENVETIFNPVVIVLHVAVTKIHHVLISPTIWITDSVRVSECVYMCMYVGKGVCVCIPKLVIARGSREYTDGKLKIPSN